MFMKDVRLKTTENENLVKEVLGNSDFKCVNMKEQSIDNMIAKEKAAKFNDQVEQYQAEMENNYQQQQDAIKELGYDVNRAEIKPMFSRILVKPFKQNPFQKIEMKGGLIVDAGGYTPHTDFNPVTGKYEEMQEFICTGCVVEVGPEVKYLQEGDAIYYRKDTAVPVPFFKQGLISISEGQIIAVINEGVTERFKSVKK